MNNNTRMAFPLAAIAAALLSVYGSAWAADDEMAALTKPQSSVRLGVGYMTADGDGTGQYTGVRGEGANELLDLDFVKRNDETGTWYKAKARNFGLAHRELSLSHERQGDWGYFFEYNQTPRYEPLGISTSLAGIGTTAQTHPAAPAVSAPRQDVQLKTQREGYALGASKQLGGGFDIQLSARTEDKDGSRLWGSGGSFLTEPINSTIRQYEGTLGYRGKKLQLSGGYYGTSYSNANSKVDVSTGLGAFSPIALPQDNESHQLFLSGGYAFTPMTRGTFKVSATEATQNEMFIAGVGVVPLVGTPGSLNGRVDTTLVQIGLSSQPIEKLSLSANLRYEDRDDKTPRVQYLTPSGSRDGFNATMSRKQVTRKAEASYELPMDMRLTGGIDVDETKRPATPTLRQVSWRERTYETSYRLELRRSMSETVNGSVAYVQSKRGGSDFKDASNNIAVDVIDPIHWANRDREKVRLSLDWTPMDALSLQFMLDAANDLYDSPTRPLGADSGKGRLYAIDAAYTITDAWQATAWVSRDENHMNQTTISGANGTIVPGPMGPITTWQARLSSVGNGVGFGVRGKPTYKVQVGADIQFVEDTNKYGMPQLSPTVGSLPDIKYRTTSLKLFGTYALEKNSSVRLDYVYDRRTSNDWTWTDWTYGTNDTTVSQHQNQNVQFIAVSYNYKF